MQDALVRVRRLAPLYFIAIALLFLWSHLALAGVSYVYDDLGRVTQASYSDGLIVQYSYDANGNLVSINRTTASALSISTVAPAGRFHGQFGLYSVRL